MLLLLLSHFSHVRLCVTPSLGFSRQEHWSGLSFPPPMHKSEKWKWSRSVMSDSSRPHGLQPTGLLHPWDFPGKRTGVGCHRLLRTRTQCFPNLTATGTTSKKELPEKSAPSPEPPGLSLHHKDAFGRVSGHMRGELSISYDGVTGEFFSL